MVGLALIISIILTISFHVMSVKYRPKTLGEVADTAKLIFGMAIFVLVAASLTMIIFISCDLGVNDKITMYQEENAAIEEQIGQLVENYMDYEKDTFSNLKGESSIVLISMYPELKSDKLVEAQIEAYMNNSRKIKSLKETAINLSKTKWLLYFGK